MPGLRRLRDPRRDAVVHARARHRAREHRLHQRDRLRGALPVLHEHVRDALDPRPRAGDRDRPRDDAARPLGLGRDGRRRRALDRRQPPDPRAAPQRQLQDPPLQQPGLRADEGAVLADERARDGDEVDADGLDRLALQPDLAGDRRRGDVRRARDRHRQEGDDRGAARRGRASRQRVRRDLPELPDLQRRRVRLRPRRQGGREPDPPPPRRADHVGQGRREGAAPAGRRDDRSLRRGRGGRARARLDARRSRRSRSRCRA